MRLGARLQAIADLVEQGTSLVDIGTDHAYLPIYLVERKIVSRAVAGEVSDGPYKAAQQTIDNAKLQGVQGCVQLRLGDGLQVIEPGEIETAVMAGMGGATIIGILEGAPRVARSLKRLIIQPMVAAAAVRRWLFDNGWYIDNEVLVVDDGRLYEIITAEQGEAPKHEEILHDIGPVLWRRKPPLLAMHLDQLIQQTHRILNGMAAGNNYSDKYYIYAEKLSQLEAKKACL